VVIVLEPAMARRQTAKHTDRRLIAFVEDLMAALQLPEVRAAVRDALIEAEQRDARARAPSPPSGRSNSRGGTRRG
jgi:hypothetical protein